MALSKIKSDSLADTAVHGRRNMLINGSFAVAQRGTSFTNLSTSTSKYYSDRWELALHNSGDTRLKSEQLKNQAPDGHYYTYKVSCTTADTTQDANNQVYLEQQVERYNINHIKYYVADADKVTISFWVKSNTTGTYGLSVKLSNGGSNHVSTSTRVYPTTYTIDAADTWEYKTKTITLDTSTTPTKGGSQSDFGTSVLFWLAAGSSRDDNTVDTWRGNNNQTATTVTANDIGGSTSNYWEVTGVQYELGDTATPFEHRSYGEELALCQRYFQIWGGKGKDFHALAMWNVSAADSSCVITFPEMRASPSATRVGGVANTSGGAVATSNWATYYAGAWRGCDALTMGTFGKAHARLDCQPNNDGGSGGARGLYGGTGCYFELSAEL